MSLSGLNFTGSHNHYSAYDTSCNCPKCKPSVNPSDECNCAICSSLDGDVCDFSSKKAAESKAYEKLGRFFWGVVSGFRKEYNPNDSMSQIQTTEILDDEAAKKLTEIIDDDGSVDADKLTEYLEKGKEVLGDYADNYMLDEKCFIPEPDVPYYLGAHQG